MEAANALVQKREGGIGLIKEQRVEIASNDVVVARKLLRGEEAIVPWCNFGALRGHQWLEQIARTDGDLQCNVQLQKEAAQTRGWQSCET